MSDKPGLTERSNRTAEPSRSFSTYYPRRVKKVKRPISQRRTALITFLSSGFAGWTTGCFLVPFLNNASQFPDRPEALLMGLAFMPIALVFSLVMPSVWLCWGACLTYAVFLKRDMSRRAGAFAASCFALAVFLLSGIDSSRLTASQAADGQYYPWTLVMFLVLVASATLGGAQSAVRWVRLRNEGLAGHGGWQEAEDERGIVRGDT